MVEWGFLMFKKLKTVSVYVFLKWLLLAAVSGALVGVAGAAFHHCLDISSEMFGKFSWLLFCMPLAGLAIVFLYRRCGFIEDKGTNMVFTAIRDGEQIKFRTAPLIFLATCLSILTGGSAGREGAALQLGGSITSFFSKVFHMSENDYKILIMCGMAAGFSSLFGTSVAAAIFAIEMISVGSFCFAAIVPCAISSVMGLYVAGLLGVHPTSFVISGVPEISITSILFVVILSVLFGLLGIVFCVSMHSVKHLAVKFFKNPYVRVVVGSIVIIALSLILRTSDYNGAGMSVVERAIEGEAEIFAFVLKLLFTAITLAVGFKGGEIVPAFFVGSTFGCVIAPVLGVDPSFGAGLGLIAVFCSVTNCPITALLLSVELFGGSGVLFFLIAVSISYMVSGYYSLYGEQMFTGSKFELGNFELHSK